jgi:uncharacterized membrane protein
MSWRLQKRQKRSYLEIDFYTNTSANKFMPNNHSKDEKCFCEILKKYFKEPEVVHIALLRPGLFAVVKRKYPDINMKGYISREVLPEFRREYIESVLEEGKGEVTKLDKEVIKSMASHSTLSKNINSEYYEERTFGQRLSDKIAEFGGSWKFISIFFAILMFWIFVNSYILLAKPFDPYPFILLNLVLSCLTAMQAPIIMMSQNRRESKDRLRSENDYRVNLKSELEIRMLHEKIDNLMHQQWERLLEIQQMQLDIMEEGKKKSK